MQYVKLPKTAVKVNGKDAITFLQGQLTQDIQHLTQPKLTARLNVKGRVLFIATILTIGQDLYLIIDNDFVELAIADLSKYKMRAKVTFEVDTNMHIFGLYSVDKCEIIVDNLPLSNNLTEVYSQEYQPTGQEISYDQWLDLSILDKAVILPFEQKEKFLIQELDLQDKAVDFKKGCYMGQEIVARVQYKGNLKKTLQVFDKTTDIGDKEMVVASQNHYLALV